MNIDEIYVLGFEVDKISKILIKTLNATECIESNIQNIEALRVDNPINKTNPIDRH